MEVLSDIEKFNRQNKYVKVHARIDASSYIVYFSGQIEMQSSTELQTLLFATIDGLQAGLRLCLDLAAVTYISSTGVGTLVSSMIKAEKRHIPFVLRNVSNHVSKILDALGMLQYFNIEDDNG